MRSAATSYKRKCGKKIGHIGGERGRIFGNAEEREFQQHFHYFTVFVWKNAHVKRDYFI